MDKFEEALKNILSHVDPNNVEYLKFNDMVMGHGYRCSNGDILYKYLERIVFVIKRFKPINKTAHLKGDLTICSAEEILSELALVDINSYSSLLWQETITKDLNRKKNG